MDIGHITEFIGVPVKFKQPGRLHASGARPAVGIPGKLKQAGKNPRFFSACQISTIIFSSIALCH